MSRPACRWGQVYQSYTLVLTTPLNASPATYNFFAWAATAGGITASVGGALGVQSPANSNGGNPSAQIVALEVSLNPSTVTVGQYDHTPFQVNIANTGNIEENVFVGSSGPSGFSTPFYPGNNVFVLPGLNSTASVTGLLQLPFERITPARIR